MNELTSILLGWLASWIQSDSGKKLGKRTRYFISIGACLICAFVANLLSGNSLEAQEILANFGVAFATSQTYYNTYFRLKK